MLPTKNYELFVTDVPTDLIAISAAAVIINVSALDTDSRGMTKPICQIGAASLF